MMTEDAIELAQRAVASKRWRWLPGMLTMSGLRVGDGSAPDWGEKARLDADLVPDLTDAATLGCLLRLVREAWADFRVSVIELREHGGYPFLIKVNRRDGNPFATEFDGETEAAALVAALEDAP